MRKITPIFFLSLFTVALLGSCSGLKPYGKYNSRAGESGNPTAPLKGSYSRALYKATMEAFGKQFSGLFLIKPEPSDSSFRVVLLSEFGLNLLDMTLTQSGTTINHCQDFLKRPVILRSIERDVRLLICRPEARKSSGKFFVTESGGVVLISRKGLTKYIYFYGPDNLPEKIERRRYFGGRRVLKLHYEQAPLPVSVTFTGRPVRHTMQLTLLNIE